MRTKFLKACSYAICNVAAHVLRNMQASDARMVVLFESSVCIVVVNRLIA